MNARVTTGVAERYELRTAAKDHNCFGWRERTHNEDSPKCSRVIAKGETYMVSTIFPGHDSGYADGGWDRYGDPVGPHPVSEKLCLGCVDRWDNTRDALARINGGVS